MIEMVTSSNDCLSTLNDRANDAGATPTTGRPGVAATSLVANFARIGVFNKPLLDDGEIGDVDEGLSGRLVQIANRFI